MSLHYGHTIHYYMSSVVAATTPVIMQSQEEGGPLSPRSVLSDFVSSNSEGGSSSSSSSKTSLQSDHHQQQEQQQAGNQSVLFPWKLHEMLQNSNKDNKEGVVSWLPDGKAFKVHNVPDFVKAILPLYFKQTKYKSFQRQLNLWGFERLTNGPMKGAYFHPNFLRDHPEWCKHLTRQRAKKAGSNSSSAPSSPAAAAKSSVQGTSKGAARLLSSSMARRPIVVGSAAAAAASNLMPRQVSESSLESFGELLREFDTAATSSNGTDMAILDLAEFEGFTFHLLEQERYEELNLEFKFNENSSHLPAAPSSQIMEGDTSVQTLLQELEQGTFGTPKTSFDGGMMAPTTTTTSGLCAV